jgi:hypothetical protein
MTSRERVRKALNHQEPDRVPVDLGSTLVTGIQASMYAKLKAALGVTEGAVKVYDPFQMLGEVEEPVKKILGVDTFGIQLPTTLFGYKNENWKPFRLFDGTDVLISGHFEYDILPNGDIVQYPKGDRSAPPSGKMPNGGFYFDSIVRQEPIDEAKLDPKKWVEQNHARYTDEELRFIEETAKWYYDNTDYALIGNFWGAGFGDIALVPGPGVLYPVGIRDPQEWYMSTILRKSYVKEIYQDQFEIQMQNLKLYQEAVGNRIEVIVMSGTDFGSQGGPFISLGAYRELYKPLHAAMNNWVHEHTAWKTFYHTCGSIIKFLDDFHEAGIDILNPVQISAKGMEPEFLKTHYGDKFIFWGGGVNVQQTLPFGTPAAVNAEVAHNISIFKPNGGFIFNAVHNIQSNIPIANLLAMFDALKAHWAY